MILVTGGTGFIGRELIRQLVALGKPVRTLLRPSAHSPALPQGVSIDVTVCSLKDERGLRAALKGVDVIYHLAGTERLSSKADLTGTDIGGTQLLAQVAAEAGVERFLFLSHLGADRLSAFPVLKAKAIAESYIQRSGVPFTIFRSSPVFGPQDQFTVPLAKLLKLSPGIFLMPGKGDVSLQPLWIEDLVTCLVYALDSEQTINQVYSIGGSEYLTFREIIETITGVLGIRRSLVSIPAAYLRALAVWMEHSFPQFPVSIFWIDYLGTDRTCSLDTLPREFGLMPARFGQQLDYLKIAAARAS